MKRSKILLNNVNEDRIVLGLLFKVCQKVSKVYDQWLWIKLISNSSVWKVINFQLSISEAENSVLE